MNETTMLSAIVWIKPASGARIDEPITASNIDKMEAAPADIERTARYFADKGLEVSAASSMMYSISGTPEQFETIFGVRLQVTGKGPATSVTTGGDSRELPLSTLEPAVAALIHTITFSEPLDFGPGMP